MADLKANRRPEVHTTVRAEHVLYGVGDDLVELHAGTVEFVGGGSYDVTVRYELDDNEVEPGRYVSSITLTARPDGRAVSVREIQRAGLGRYLKRAGELLTRANGAFAQATGPLADHARQAIDHPLPTRTGRPVAITAEELQLAADAYRVAANAGVSRRAAVRDVLRRKGYVATPGAVKRRIDLARARGLLPDAGGSTRPRLNPADG